MTPHETIRGFVNTWDCDENAHLNVQFYVRFFDEAADHFLAAAGFGAHGRPRAAVRHVRYHSELRAGQLVRVVTHAAPPDTDGRWRLVHRLMEASTGRLAATAVDAFDDGDAARAAALASGPVPDDAAPRSLAAAPSAMIAAPGALRTHAGRLRPDELTGDGRVRYGAIVGRFSDAAGHLWESLGADQPWLADNDYGRAVLEMKVTGGGPASGLVHVVSWPMSAGGKTLSFAHALVATDSGKVVGRAEATAVLFDRARRAAVALPDRVRERVETAG